MNKNFLQRGVLVVLLAFLGVLVTHDAFSGELKQKFQGKMNGTKNIQFGQNVGDDINGQYDPYYLERNSDLQMRNAIQEPQSTIVSNEKPMDARNARGQSNPCVAPPPGPAMSTYAIYQANYSAELEENVVTVNGKVNFEIFQKGWTKLPLVATDVGLINVSVNRGTAFVTMENGKYYLMLDKPGRYSLDIEFLIKAQRERENGPGSFAIELMPAPIAQYEFTMAETDVEVFIEPSIRTEVKIEGGKTVAWSIMPNTNSIKTRWTKALPKEEIQHVKLEPKVFAEMATIASVGEGLIRCSSQINYSILQSEVSTFRVALPKDVSILDVVARDLRDWKSSVEGDVQYVDVYLNFGVKGGFGVTLVYERGIGEGSVVAQLPEIKALGVERENGSIGIAAKSNVELAVNKISHVTPIDVKELPSAIWSDSSSPLLLAFKYLNHPYEVAVDVTRHEELPVLVAAVDSVDALTLRTKEGKVLTKVTYEVRNNVKQFLRVTLPKGATLWSAFVSGKPVKPAKDKSDSVLIPLEKSQFQGDSLTRFPVEIVYLDVEAGLKTWLGNLSMDLPKIDLPISELYWNAFMPKEFIYFNFGGDVEVTQKERRYQTMATGRLMRASGMSKKGADSIQDEVSTIATQYTAYQQVATPQERSGEIGLLPIKIDVPQQGQSVRFSKLLVTENESPRVTMWYLGVVKKFGGLLRWAIFFGLIYVVIRLIRRRQK